MNFLLDEDLPQRDILTVKPTGILKAAGMGIMSGGANVAAAGVRAVQALQMPLNPRGAEKTKRFYREYIKPARDFWTPDPESLTTAGELINGVSGLGFPLMLGPLAPAVLVGQAGINTAFDLYEEGVDPYTAAGAGAFDAATMAALVRIPAFGKTIKQTLGLAAVNPVAGAASRKGIQELLQYYGYDKQAKSYDPYDPTAISIDATLGVFFGAYGHAMRAGAKRAGRKTFEAEKAKAIERLDKLLDSTEYHEYLKTLPVEAEDAIGVIRQHQKLIKDMPFDFDQPRSVRVHLDAMNKAIKDLSQDKPVDVRDEVADIQRPIYPESYSLDEMTRNLKEKVNLSDEQLDGVNALLRANAKAAGEDIDSYISKRFAGIVKGDISELEASKLYQAADLSKPFYSKLQETIEQKMPNKADAQTVRGLIKNIKADEVKWSGIEDFLEGKGKVTKEEVVDFLRSNEVKVAEVVKGESPENQYFTRTNVEAGEIEAIDARTGEVLAAERTEESLTEAMKGTKYSQYTLPGGEGYKELLLTLPEERDVVYTNDNVLLIDPTTDPMATDPARFWYFKVPDNVMQVLKKDFKTAQEAKAYILKKKQPEPMVGTNYQSSHWDESNVLAHVRFNDRVDTQGNKVLFIEELQSDWHQAGKKKGYVGELPEGFEVRQFKDHPKQPWYIVNRDGRRVAQASGLTRQEAILKYGRLNAQIPDAPFKKNWHELTLKRMLRYAAENGYDKVAWIDGEQTAKRYDLSKKVSKVIYLPESKVLVAKGLSGEEVIREHNIAPAKVEDYIGKEPARKLLDAPIKGNEQIITGLDLKVGGQWAYNLYDKMIPSFLKKYGKKWGAKVGDVILDQGIAKRESFRSKSIDITPKMKDAVLYDGQPMFQTFKKKPKGAVHFIEDGRAVIHAFEGADLTTVVHELGHVFRRYVPAADLKILESEYKIKDGKWNVDAEEAFARGFEKYITEGNAPTPKLQKVFDKFKKWMIGVYRNLIGADARSVRLEPEVRKVMDRLFIESEIPLKKAEAPEAVKARETVKAEIKDLDNEIMREAEGSGIPLENTVIEDWGTRETIVPGEKTKQKQIERIKNRQKAKAEVDALDKDQLRFIKERIESSDEGSIKTFNADTTGGLEVTGRLGSPYPDWYKSEGYTRKNVLRAIKKALQGEKLGKKQLKDLKALLKNSRDEYGQMYEIDEPVARFVESVLEEQGDIPTFAGTDAKGEPIDPGMKKGIDDAKADFIKTLKLKDTYMEIAKCIR